MSFSAPSRTNSHAAPPTWMIIVLALAMPVLSYPLAWFPQGTLPHRFELLVPLPQLFLAGLLTTLLFSLRRSFPLDLPRSGVDRSLLAVVGVHLISAILSSNIVFSIAALCLLLAHVALFYATTVWFDLRRLPLLQAAWLAVAAIEAWYAVWQIVPGLRSGLQELWAQTGNAGEGSPWGKLGFWTAAAHELTTHGGPGVATIGNKDWAAGYLAISALVCFPLWLAAGRRRWQLWLVGAAYAVIFVGLLCCASTGAWLGLLVGAGLCVFRLAWDKRPLAALAGLGLVLVIAAGLALANFSNMERYWHRNVRPPIWKGVLHMIQASPLIGTGPGTFPYQYAQYRPAEYFTRPQATNYTDHAHNEFLEITAETGLFGLGVMLWLVGIVLLRGWRGWNREDEHRWHVLAAWGAVIALLVHNLFDVNLRCPPNRTLWWLLMGLIIAVTRRPLPETPDGRPPAAQILSPRLGRPTLAATLGFLTLLLLYSQVLQPFLSDLYFRRALIARGKQDWKAAIANYERSLRFQPYRVEAWYRLAWLCAQFPETSDQAILYYQQVAELAPDYADVNANLSYLLYHSGRKSEAAIALERMVERNPGHCEGLATLARVYLEMKRDADARRVVLDLLKACPDHPWGNEIWEQKFRKEPSAAAPARKPRPRIQRPYHRGS